MCVSLVFFCFNVHEMCFELKFRFVSKDTLIIIDTDTHDLSLPIGYVCMSQYMSYEATGYLEKKKEKRIATINQTL